MEERDREEGPVVPARKQHQLHLAKHLLQLPDDKIKGEGGGAGDALRLQQMGLIHSRCMSQSGGLSDSLYGS